MSCGWWPPRTCDWSLQTQSGTAKVCLKPPYVDQALHSACIFELISIRLHVPVALGLGAAAIEDKVASTFHQLAVESRDVSHLVSELRKYRSVTLDMGMEVKIVKCCTPSRRLERLLPPWMSAEAATRAEDLDNDAEDLQPEASLGNSLGHAFLRNAFTIGFCHHLISLVAKDTSSSLQDFESFYAMLKVEE